MKSIVWQKKLLWILRPKPSIDFLSYFSYSSSASINNTLTQDELKQINRLIPRLCSSSSSSSTHLKHAIHLISAAILTSNPPVNSLPLSILVDRLALEPDLTLPMYFLNAIKYNIYSPPEPTILTPIATMLVSSFFHKDYPKKALKIFQWVSRPDFPAGILDKDSGFYSLMVDGFAKNGMMLEALRVLRVMASENMVATTELRRCVYMGLLREARIREAVDLNAALGGGTGMEVVLVLDRIIADWLDGVEA